MVEGVKEQLLLPQEASAKAVAFISLAQRDGLQILFVKILNNIHYDPTA
jgi:hypothetical protein